MSIENESEEVEIEHAHCKNCFNLSCNKRSEPPDSCHLISCEQNCGLRFHACKLDEHRCLCPVAKVPCINFTNGCPIILPRHQLGSHLARCPASVIQCTMEWNRWPVYSKERQSRVPFVHDNIHARYGQLDVALALRDQRILNEAMKAPRSTRRALRNQLTQRFPAVPLSAPSKGLDINFPNSQSSEASQSVSDDDPDAPWELKKNPPGLQRSVCSELFRATKKTTESLSAALSIATGGMGPSVTGLQPMTDVSESLAHADEKLAACMGNAEYNGVNNHISTGSESLDQVNDTGKLSDTDTKLVKAYDSEDDGMRIKLSIRFDSDDRLDQVEENKSPIPEPPTPAPCVTLKEILALDLNLESITRYQAKPKSMYTFLCAQEFRRDEYMWHFKNIHNDIHAGLNGWLEQRCPLAHYGCTFSIQRFYPGCKGNKVVYNTVLESFGVKPSLPRNIVTAASENQEKLFDKIENIYEEGWHMSPSGQSYSKESTPEIFTSQDYNSAVQINGNIECIKLRKGEKNQDGHQVESENQAAMEHEALLLCSDNKPITETDERSYVLTNLPFEMLQYICEFLDSFSMCNLSLTCKLLREVACSLLEVKGIVIQQWQRERLYNQTHWYIGYKRWIFSTAFDPIHEWGFEEHIHMSEHIKHCPFYRKTHHIEPYALPFSEFSCAQTHSPNFEIHMQRMYPDYKLQEGELSASK